MPSLRERIADGISHGTFRAGLAADALQWRAHHSDYAISTVVRYALEDDLADEVHDILTDEQFRHLRISRFGAPALRDDLNLGADYFSRTRPDLLRYVRVLFRQRSAERDDTYALLHRRHCHAFAEFLQLDIPSSARRDIGLNRVLCRLFPMRLPDEPDADPAAEVNLTGYELGTWACSCGAREGHAARYEYACRCGAKAGNGKLPPRARCRQCKTSAAYVTCDRCDTRVTLGLWWRIRQGGLHPSDYQIPLTLDLSIRRPGMQAISLRLELMRMPLMLGLIQRDDELVFDLPDLLWVDDVRDRHGDERSTGQLIVVADHPRYDRQTDVVRILEHAFRRTLTNRGGRAGSTLAAFVGAPMGIGRRRRYQPTADWFSWQFARKIGYGLSTDQHESAGLARGTDMSRPCVVGVSPDLQSDACLVSRTLSAPGTLSSSGLDNVGVSVRFTPHGREELTAEPPRVPPERCRALAADGIVMPGEMVEPGDVLVGISEPVDPENLTPEERLLRAIFEERFVARRDASFRWVGRQPARVLSVHIKMEWYGDQEIVEHPARVIRMGSMRAGEWARIDVSLAPTDPLETGDRLYGPDETRAVVCGTHDSNSADILVGARHRWANERQLETIDVRLHPDERSRTVVQARSTGAYSIITQLPVRTRHGEPGQPIQFADLLWLLHHHATRTAYELYALRADCIEGRIGLYRLLVGGESSAHEIPMAPPEEDTQLDSAPIEAARSWNSLLRGACIETLHDRGRLAFSVLDDAGVLAASSGEVVNSGTLNPMTGLPVPGGLICQRTFGPLRDYTCGCGTSHRPTKKGESCEHCGVTITLSRVRRKRMGHIELFSPVVHPWYRDSLSRLLGIPRTTLDDICLGRHVISRLPAGEDAYLAHHYCTGEEAVRMLLDRQGQTAPRGAFLRRLPVIPADLRSVAVVNGQMYVGALNSRYADIMKHNAELRRLVDLDAPSTVIDQARGAVQGAVDALLDQRDGDASLANLYTILPGRSGGFRQRLFERPVDYCAQTTLVPAPTGALDVALLPDRLGWVLMMPVVMRRMVDAGDCSNIRAAKRAVQDRTSQAWKHLQAACEAATMLVSVPDTRWPLFAVRVELTPDLSLKLDPALFDHLGWDRLGGPVRVFPLLTAEAGAEARASLLPSVLLRDPNPPQPAEPPASLLGLDLRHLPEEIVRMTETGESAHLGDLDRFLLFPS